jgi:hypothetical protein
MLSIDDDEFKLLGERESSVESTEVSKNRGRDPKIYVTKWGKYCNDSSDFFCMKKSST